MNTPRHVGPGTPGFVRLRKETALKELTDFDSENQAKLLEVMRELEIPTREHDPDEGSWTPSENAWIPYERQHLIYYYRRGLTRQKRLELDEASRHEQDMDDAEAGQNLWDYFIIYRRTTSSECIKNKCPRGITIEHIWPTAKVLSKLNLHDILSKI